MTAAAAFLSATPPFLKEAVEAVALRAGDPSLAFLVARCVEAQALPHAHAHALGAPAAAPAADGPLPALGPVARQLLRSTLLPLFQPRPLHARHPQGGPAASTVDLHLAAAALLWLGRPKAAAALLSEGAGERGGAPGVPSLTAGGSSSRGGGSNGPLERAGVASSSLTLAPSLACMNAHLDDLFSGRALALLGAPADLSNRAASQSALRYTDPLMCGPRL